MCDLKSQAQGVEFGTSPHGLSADLLRTHQETGRPVNLPFLEDQQGEAAQDAREVEHERRGEALTATERTAQSAGAPYAGESAAEVRQTLGGHTFNITEEQRQAVAFALLNQIEEIQESDEATEPEVMEELHYLESAWEILRLEGEFK